MREQKRIDEQFRRMAELEPWRTPDSCKNHIEQILETLPDTPVKEETMGNMLKKRTLILAVALAALVGTTAMASGLFRWNEKAAENFGNPAEEEQDAMTMEGLAREQQVSASDAGIIITAKQTVQDKNTLYILLDIQAEEAVIDGNGGFDRTAEDGTYGEPWLITEQEDAFGNVSMGFTPDTPAFETLSDHGYYEISALKTIGREWSEKEVTVHFTEYNYYTYENGDTVPHTIRGNWTLTLPLGEDTMLEKRVCEPEQPVDICGASVHVKRVEISPLSLLLVFDMDDRDRLMEMLYPNEEDVYLKETEVTGFLDQDGKEIPIRMGGMSGSYDFDNREVMIQIGLGNYVEAEQVSAVLLGEEKIPVPLP